MGARRVRRVTRPHVKRNQAARPSFGDTIAMPNTIRVAVTGAAGQVAYALLGRLASGEIFGPNTKVILQLLEIPQAMAALEGVAMELDDCSFPTLKEIVVT